MNKKFLLGAAMLIGSASAAHAATYVTQTAPAPLAIAGEQDSTVIIAPATTTVTTVTTAPTVAVAVPAVTDEDSRNPRAAAGHFIEHVNDARQALQSANPSLAQGHIAVASQLADAIGARLPAGQQSVSVDMGRSAYTPAGATAPVYQYRYFPTETGYVEQVTKIEAAKLVPVNQTMDDVEALSFTVDFSDRVAQHHLADANAAIAGGDLRQADHHLSVLLGKIMQVADEDGAPIDLARHNIALARQFIIQSNYVAASRALGHADNALERLQRNVRYKEHHASVVSMRIELDRVKESLAHNTAPAQAVEADMQRWWTTLYRWARA